MLQITSIQPNCTGGFTAGFRAEAPGYVNIVVDEKDLPQARKILATTDLEEAKVDWSKVDVGEPDN